MNGAAGVAGKRWDAAYAVTLAAIFVTGIASAGLLAFKPLIVGALIDEYRFSPAEAGFVAGIEMAGIGIASFTVAAFGGTWNRRLVIAAGATLGILGSIAPIVTDAFTPILVSRLVAGMGSGLIAANVLAVIGTTRDPDRTFGLYYMTTYAGMALLVPGGIWMLSHFGVAGGYVLIALLLALVYVTVLRIPGSVAGLRGEQDKVAAAPFPFAAGGLSLGLSLIFWVGVGAVWAFMERIGVEAGLDIVTIGGVVALGPIASIAGALTASLLHTRLGRLPMLIAAVGLAMLGVGLIGWGGSAALFVLGFLAFSYSWPLFLAYLGGAMAVVDPMGRVVAMSVASQTLGMAIGPAIGGVVAELHGYVGISVLGVACFALALPVIGLLQAMMRR